MDLNANREGNPVLRRVTRLNRLLSICLAYSDLFIFALLFQYLTRPSSPNWSTGWILWLILFWEVYSFWKIDNRFLHSLIGDTISVEHADSRLHTQFGRIQQQVHQRMGFSFPYVLRIVPESRNVVAFAAGTVLPIIVFDAQFASFLEVVPGRGASVMTHELGHLVSHDGVIQRLQLILKQTLRKGSAFIVLSSMFGLLVPGLNAQPQALLINACVGAAVWVYTHFIGRWQLGIARKLSEHGADAFTASCGYGEELIHALKFLSNIAELPPDAPVVDNPNAPSPPVKRDWIDALDTHPTTHQRVRLIRQVALASGSVLNRVRGTIEFLLWQAMFAGIYSLWHQALPPLLILILVTWLHVFYRWLAHGYEPEPTSRNGVLVKRLITAAEIGVGIIAINQLPSVLGPSLAEVRTILVSAWLLLPQLWLLSRSRLVWSAYAFMIGAAFTLLAGWAVIVALL